MFNLFGKNKHTDDQKSSDEIPNFEKSNTQLSENLSWSDGNISDQMYVKSHSTSNMIDPEKIAAASSIAISSNKIYNTTPQEDTVMVVFVRKLENFPSADEIQRKREIFQENIDKLDLAKSALNKVTRGMHDTNPSLLEAYTIVDSDLRHAVVEQRSFEAKLKMETQSIEEILDLFQNSSEYKKVELLASLYGFTKDKNHHLQHESMVGPNFINTPLEEAKPKEIFTDHEKTYIVTSDVATI